MIGKELHCMKSAMMEMSMVAEGYCPIPQKRYKLNQAYGAKSIIIDAVYSIYEVKPKLFKKTD
jgi:glycerol-3-phosphate dehydrogenase (NAD(P)+)